MDRVAITTPSFSNRVSKNIRSGLCFTLGPARPVFATRLIGTACSLLNSLAFAKWRQRGASYPDVLVYQCIRIDDSTRIGAVRPILAMYSWLMVSTMCNMARAVFFSVFFIGSKIHLIEFVALFSGMAELAAGA